jgi:hypothetical protein
MTHIMSHHLMFGIACHNTSRVSPSCQLSARQLWIIFQATLYYIWYSRFNSRVARTWCALLGDILLILRTFPIACRGFTILLNLFCVSFVSYLRPTGHTVPSYLVLFTIKSHVHRTEKSSHYHPSEPLRLRIRNTRQNFVFRSRDFAYCRPLSPFTYLSVYFVAPRRVLSLAIVPRRSSSPLVVSSRILLGILLYILFSLFSFYLLGC